MSREAQFNSSGTIERGERIRFAEALTVFEDMHRTLKARAVETPEHRALEGIDAALALVAGSTRATHLDMDGFEAFRSSVEILDQNTPEARALQLFEGALRAMIASATDFDDLPDAEDEADAIAGDGGEDGPEDNPADSEDAEPAEPAADTAVVVTIYDAVADAAGAPESEPGDDQAATSSDAIAEDAGADHGVAAEGDPAPEDGHGPAAGHAVDGDPSEVQQRIEELEAELAAARASQAA